MFLFAAFNILSLLLFFFSILIIVCLGVAVFGFILFGILLLSASRYVSIPNLRKFSVIISSNRFSDLLFLLLSLWDPYTMSVGCFGRGPGAGVGAGKGHTIMNFVGIIQSVVFVIGFRVSEFVH